MQTHEQVIIKVRELLSHATDAAMQRVAHVLQSGALDLDTADNNYRLPKILVVDALRYAVSGYQPRADSALQALLEKIETV